MEENKYYIPEIEDLRIGYECEINEALGYQDKFTPTIIGFKTDEGYKNELSDVIIMMDDGYGEVRTPYLTKEQIEKEGWKVQFGNDKDFWCQFIKDKFLVIYYFDTKLLTILNTERSCSIYGGSCNSINEFRTICKFLNIK